MVAGTSPTIWQGSARRVFVQQDVQHDVDLHRGLNMIAILEEKASLVGHLQRQGLIVDHREPLDRRHRPHGTVDLRME